MTKTFDYLWSHDQMDIKKIKPSSGSTLFFCIEPDGYTIAVARVVAHIVERRAHEQPFSIAD
jgi:hypothetical protein